MIIGLVGFKQVGKSTAAKHLEMRGFGRINMKDALIKEITQNFSPLLEELCKIYDKIDPLPYKFWEINDLFEIKPPAMRTLMQNYGTEVRRGDRDSYWTDQWIDAVRSSKSTHIVVDDVRFLNEADAVRKMGGIIIRLTRPDITSGGTHSSEVEQLKIVADHTIDCVAGNQEHLYAKLDGIVYQ